MFVYKNVRFRLSHVIKCHVDIRASFYSSVFIFFRVKKDKQKIYLLHKSLLALWFDLDKLRNCIEWKHLTKINHIICWIFSLIVKEKRKYREGYFSKWVLGILAFDISVIYINIADICCETVKGSKIKSKVGDQEVPFSIATTPRCKGGRYSFLWIAPLYPWSVPYNAEC